MHRPCLYQSVSGDVSVPLLMGNVNETKNVYGVSPSEILMEARVEKMATEVEVHNPNGCNGMAEEAIPAHGLGSHPCPFLLTILYLCPKSHQVETPWLQKGKELANDSTARLGCNAMVTYAQTFNEFVRVAKEKEFHNQCKEMKNLEMKWDAH